MIYKTLHKKLKIEQHGTCTTQNRRGTHLYSKGMQFMLHWWHPSCSCFIDHCLSFQGLWFTLLFYFIWFSWMELLSRNLRNFCFSENQGP